MDKDNNIKVLISDKMSDYASATFRGRGICCDIRYDLTPEELSGVIGDYDGIAIRSSTRITGPILKAAQRLKVIGRAGIGIDNVDLELATAKGVVVMNAPFGNSITTAEHTVAMMLALARHIPQADRSTHEGKWEKTKYLGVEVARKTIGIIGCGNVGSIVADRAQGMKMKVLSYDPYLSEEYAKDLGIEKVSLDDLLARSDFVTLHVPLTEKTREIINCESIKKMKVGARLINCARGSLVNEDALKQALKNGHLAGAAVDVFSQEPPGRIGLLQLDNLIATPHLGASTSEAQENVAVQIAEQMSDYLLLGAVSNALNMPAVSSEEAPKMRPYITLASQLGLLVGQLIDKALVSVTIEFCGLVANLNTKSLAAITLEGLLKKQLESVNMVNAPMIARERNIEVREVTTDISSNYQALIKLIAKTDDERHEVSGTLFSNQDPRVVEIDGIKVEAELSGNMLFLVNEDKPGIIGNLGTTLGASNVNIATFHLGRTSRGGNALALISVDAELNEEVLSKVRELRYVKEVRALYFS